VQSMGKDNYPPGATFLRYRSAAVCTDAHNNITVFVFFPCPSSTQSLEHHLEHLVPAITEFSTQVSYPGIFGRISALVGSIAAVTGELNGA